MAAALFIEEHRQNPEAWQNRLQPNLESAYKNLIGIRSLQLATDEREPLSSMDDHLMAGIIKLALDGDKSQRFADRLADPRNPIASLFAAEFFPDLNPPKLIVADDPLDLHDDLREKFEAEIPPGSLRISGEVLTLKETGLKGPKFFSLDPVRLESPGKLPTKAQLEEVVEQLVALNYVPLDAECYIIDPSAI